MRPADTWKDYELLDATDGNRLERWGETILIRPDPQVVWKTPKQSSLWAKADAVYHRSNQGGGEWEYKRHLPEKWKISCGEGEDKLTLIVSPTGFKPACSRSRLSTGHGTPKRSVPQAAR